MPKPNRINLRPYRILYWPLLLPVALLLALFNRLSPIPFRIYSLRVDRIGQMAGNQEELCCKLDLGLLPREFRVFIFRDHPCNTVLLDMQKRILPIHNVFLPLFDVCHKLGGLGVSSMTVHRYSGRDWNQLVTKTPQHLFFSPEEEEEARKQCQALGIDPDKPFVAVLARDNAYLNHINEPTEQDSYRNDDINTYVPAMEYLADDWKVIRMGSVVGQKLKTNHPNILDYSQSGRRTELLDVYLSARCTFFMSCGTGLDSITSCCFRKPVLYVNFVPPANAPILKPGSIFIPKKYRFIENNMDLTLTQLIESGAGHHFLPSELNPMGIIVQDNTPQEIMAAAIEMKARLSGKWNESEEDQRLQERFWELFRNKQWRQYKCVGLIGSDFLRNNRHWMQ